MAELRTAILIPGLVAVLMLAPVTMPVPVLRGLVQDRFAVGDFLTSLFMSINMVGALLAAPVAGAVADRIGRHKGLMVAALLVDALCLLLLAAPLPFGVFLAVRFIEGCAHITALSLLLSLAGSSSAGGRARAMAGVGSGITHGVAHGAPVGGALGRSDPLAPLRIGAGVLLVAAVVVLSLQETAPRRHPSSLGRIVALARQESVLLVPYAFAFVDRFTVGFFTTTFTLYMKNVHDLPVARIGLLLGLFMGPFALLAYPCGRLSERRSRSKLVAGGSLAYGIAAASLGAWSPAALPLLMLGLGVLSAVMFVPSLLLVTDLAPERIRATALGGFNAAGSLGFVVGPLVGGAVSEIVGALTSARGGYAAAFAIAGIAEVLCVVAAWPALRRLRAAGRIS